MLNYLAKNRKDSHPTHATQLTDMMLTLRDSTATLDQLSDDMPIEEARAFIMGIEGYAA